MDCVEDLALNWLKTTAITALTKRISCHSLCCLDWCNSLLYGVPEYLLRKVQLVQNTAARLITSTRHRDHITPVLHQLHCLPVQRRVDLRLHVLYTNRSLQRRHRTCLPTSDSSPSMVVLISVHLLTEH